MLYFLLSINGEVVANPQIILQRMCSFFSNLLAAKPPSGFSISPDLWHSDSKVTPDENAALMVPSLLLKLMRWWPHLNPTLLLARTTSLLLSLRSFGLPSNIWCMRLSRSFA